MKTPSVCVRAVAGVLCSLIVAWTALVADEPPRPKEAEKERPSQKQAAEYKALFEKVGRAGLPDLTKDKDTSLALQASWELHKKLVKRTKRAGPVLKDVQSNETYDAAEVKKFVEFVKERTKAPVPGWWADRLADLDVYKERSHLSWAEAHKLKEVALGKEDVWRVRDGVTLALKDGTISYRSGDVSLEFPKNLFDITSFEDALADLVTEKVTCLAKYRSELGGGRFRVAGFENKSGKHIWSAETWPVHPFPHFGPTTEQRVEMTRAGDTVFVFGATTRGLYVEAFDLGTGKCQFRFCTSYWGNPSEQWNLKPGD